MPKIKTVKEMKNVSNGIISRQETAEERISKLENILIKFLETEKQRAKSRVKQNRISEGCGKTTRGVTYTQWKLLLLFSWCAVLRLVTQSCLTLCHSMVCSPPGSSVRGNSPGKNTGMSCHALLQGNFPIPGSNPGLPHCRQILYHVSPQGSPRILEWLAYPFSGDLPEPEVSPGFPALQADSLPAEVSGKPCLVLGHVKLFCEPHGL